MSRTNLEKLTIARKAIDEVIADMAPVGDPPAPPAPDPDPPAIEPDPDTTEGAEPDSPEPTIVRGQWVPRAPHTGEKVVARNTLFLTPERTGFKDGYHRLLTDAQSEAACFDIEYYDCEWRPEEPNYPFDHQSAGTSWLNRLHGVRNMKIHRGVARHCFGNSYFKEGVHPQATSLEGHGFYVNISPIDGSRYEFLDLDMEGGGGQALQFMVGNVGGTNPHRGKLLMGPDGKRHPLPLERYHEFSGKVPTYQGAYHNWESYPAQPGGRIVVKDSRFHNFGMCPSRGSSALTFIEGYCSIDLERVTVSSDTVCAPVHWNGDPAKLKTMGGLTQRGEAPYLNIIDSRFTRADGGNSKGTISIRGAHDVLIENTYIDGKVEIKTSGHYLGDTDTRRVILRNCTGPGFVQVGTKKVCDVTDNRDIEVATV